MATARTIFVVALAGLAFVSWPTPAAALSDPPDQVVLTGAVVVPRGADAGEVVVLHGSARVDGVVHGDVVVVDGPVVVRGQVSGSVVAVDGRVVIGGSAQVNGDVASRGTVDVGDAAVVRGRVRQHVAFAWRTPIQIVGRFASWLAVSVSTLLLGLLLVLIAPRALDAVALVARSSPWQSLGWAIATAIGVPVAVILAMASMVALPLGLVALLGAVPLAFLGYAASAYAIGRLLRPPPMNRTLAFGAGWLLLRAVGAIPFVSGITFGVAAAFGLGAGAIAVWRARATAGRHRERRVAPAVASPLGEEAGL